MTKVAALVLLIFGALFAVAMIGLSFDAKSTGRCLVLVIGGEAVMIACALFGVWMWK
jgi:hypothetical protein